MIILNHRQSFKWKNHIIISAMWVVETTFHVFVIRLVIDLSECVPLSLWQIMFRYCGLVSHAQRPSIFQLRHSFESCVLLVCWHPSKLWIGMGNLNGPVKVSRYSEPSCRARENVARCRNRFPTALLTLSPAFQFSTYTDATVKAHDC